MRKVSSELLLWSRNNTQERDVAQMGRRIDLSWGGYIRSSQCSTTGVTMTVVCIILSVGWCI